MEQNFSFWGKSLVRGKYLSLLSVQFSLELFDAFLVFDDLVSTFDLTIQGLWYYTLRYSFN